MTIASGTNSQAIMVSFGTEQVPVRAWRGEQLQSLLALDCETVAFEENDPAPCPELVLVSVFDGELAYLIRREAVGRFLVTHRTAEFVGHNFAGFDFAVIERFLREHNEQGAREILWDLAASSRLHDTALLDRLVRLGSPRTAHTVSWSRSLDDLSRVLRGVELAKDPAIRLCFGEILQNGRADYSRLTHEAIRYSARDAIATLRVFEELSAQAAVIGEHGRTLLPGAVQRFGLLSETIQVRGAIALAEITRRGLMVDVERVKHLERTLSEELDRLGVLLEPTGVVRRCGQGWSKSNNALKAHLRGLAGKVKNTQGQQLQLLPLNGRGDVSMRAGDWEAWSQDEFVGTWLKFKEISSLLSGFVKGLASSSVVRSRYNVIVRTGRTASSSPNVQGFPREGNVRECFRPRDGYVFLVLDYRFVELVTLAQTQLTWYGTSKLCETINAGHDPHLVTASQLAGKQLLDVSKEERQHAKAVNFGFPGGLGVGSFLGYAKDTYGISLTKEQATAYRSSWIRTYPEMERWLTSDDLSDLAQSLRVSVEEVLEVFEVSREESGWIPVVVRHVAEGRSKKNGEPYKPTTVRRVWELLSRARLPPELAERVQALSTSPDLAQYLQGVEVLTLTGRVRAGCSYTQARNCPFQGLSGDGAKLALFELTRAGYRLVAFIHDEVVLEVPESTENDYERIIDTVRRIMVDSMREVCPDVRVGVDAYVSRSWSKAPPVEVVRGTGSKPNHNTAGAVPSLRSAQGVEASNLARPR